MERPRIVSRRYALGLLGSTAATLVACAGLKPKKESNEEPTQPAYTSTIELSPGTLDLNDGIYNINLNNGALVDNITIADKQPLGLTSEFCFVVSHDAKFGNIEIAGQLQLEKEHLSSFAYGLPVSNLKEYVAHKIKIIWHQGVIIDTVIDGRHIPIYDPLRKAGEEWFQQNPNPKTTPYPNL